MTKKNQDFSMYAGDTKDIIVTVTDNGAAANLSGATIKWAMKKSLTTAAAASKSIGNGITISGGTFTVRLNSADTQGIQGRYYHEAEITDVLGNVSTVMTGYITIEPSGV